MEKLDEYIPEKTAVILGSATSYTLHEKFCLWFTQIAKESIVELFELETDGSIRIVEKTTKKRTVRLLTRSKSMEAHLLGEAKKVTLSHSDKTAPDFEGLHYFVLTGPVENPILIYIGLTGKYGRDGERLNLNLENLEKKRDFFARWGDDYARHIGGLSNAILNNGFPTENKYRVWADYMLEAKDEKVYPKFPIKFFALAWSKSMEDYLGRHLDLKEFEQALIQELGPIINTKVQKTPYY